ncbi:hypothetical protein CVU75_02855 [Candidatus Dependentiae bacterium HGW-Dependentiae-1]|nr:MAG: hypothetical protein CVU75_02855 [Candidatus Dependentiae bacterium HGW-Dependentiae-1]
MFVDTHCHLNLMARQQTGEQPMDDIPLTQEQLAAIAPIVDAAAQENVNTILTIGTTLTESRNSITIAQQHPSVWAVVGLHPNDCTTDWRNAFASIKNLVADKEKNKLVGIGETGLDYYWPNYHKQHQRDAFKAHIELALAHDLALVIHLRPSKPSLTHELTLSTPDSAQDELFELLLPYKNQITRGIMHCFSHDNAFAQTALEWGFVLGIGGVITYPKNESLRDIIRTIPLEKLVLETDAPFLAPQIARGKQNHPKYIAIIAQFLADLKGVNLHEVATQTTATAQRIFGTP